MKYTVQKNDTLRLIAIKKLGDESKWNAIWSMNQDTIKSGDPSILSVGEVLDIPEKSTPPRPPVPSDEPTAYDVKLIINDKNFEGWEEVRVQRSIEAVAGAFSLTVSDPGNIDISEGAECSLKFGGETVILGYVDDTEMSLDGSSHTFTINGRDKTGDLVDCSVQTSPSEWNGKKLDAIAKALCKPFGIDVWAEVDVGAAIDKFTTQPGETVLEALSRAAKGKKVLLTSSAKGMLLITRAGTDKTGVTLKEGENIKSITVSKSIKERFSKYVVEGQPAVIEGFKDQDGAVTATVGRATDSAVKRYRPMVIMAEEKGTQAYCNARAAWEAKIRAGKSLTITVVVAGWWMPNGKLWRPNSLVNVEAPSVRAKGEFLIAEIEYVLNNEGTTTTLTLRTRAAYTDEVES